MISTRAAKTRRVFDARVPNWQSNSRNNQRRRFYTRVRALGVRVALASRLAFARLLDNGNSIISMPFSSISAVRSIRRNVQFGDLFASVCSCFLYAAITIFFFFLFSFFSYLENDDSSFFHFFFITAAFCWTLETTKTRKPTLSSVYGKPMYSFFFFFWFESTLEQQHATGLAFPFSPRAFAI